MGEEIEQKQKKRFSGAEENLICAVAIIVGVTGSFIIDKKLPFSIAVKVGPFLLISLPFFITSVIIYYFTKNSNKALISAILATILSFIVWIFLGIGVLMPTPL